MSNPSALSGVPVELASKGRYYQSGSSRAVLSPITGQHEALLADANSQTFPAVISQVLKDLVSELPCSDFGKLLIGDKYHLLFHLRMISYTSGKKYSCTVTCPSCSTPNYVDFNLEKDVHIKGPPENATEPFEVVLPASERVAKVRLLRVDDEGEMVKFIRRFRREGLRGDPAYLYSVARGLISIEDQVFGPDDIDEAVSWVRSAQGMDTQALRDAIDAYDVGPELDMEFTCESCSHYWYQRLPLDADFFRPGKAEQRRTRRSKV
jgi:hypothetical protein